MKMLKYKVKFKSFLKGPYHGSVKLFTELFKITARLVNNLSNAPSAQDNLSKLLTMPLLVPTPFRFVHIFGKGVGAI